MPRESQTARKKRAEQCIALLREHYPEARCSLNFRSVHQLMVATILSAQCTDERVNMVTRQLFKKYRSVRDFAEADLEELAGDIHSTGFHNSKAKSIKHSAQVIVNEYNGRVPKNLDELVKLPGVGRKTGSVILGAGYGLAEGVVVDTHVGRISRRLGFTARKDPEKVERDLIKVIPQPDWIDYAYLLIDHGRAICKARRPKCGACFLADLCPSAGKV
jgi:endonuclease-3